VRCSQILRFSGCSLARVACTEIHWGDSITLQHKGTKAYLHSHLDRYPLKYDDGRISSQGQQVTGYPFNDTNNVWKIVRPEGELPHDAPEEERIVRHTNQIRLLHVNSQSYLLAHDVASPLMATNEEFTVHPANDSSRFNDTVFEFNIDGVSATSRKAWKSKAVLFRLIHVPTRVSMWTHTETPLPDWGYNQQEINGNKNAMEKTALWFVDDLMPDEGECQARRAPSCQLCPADNLFVHPDSPLYVERTEPLPPRPKTRMSFLRKFAELQITMLQQNSQLTQSHPYATGPLNWPFLLQGISFWTEDATLKQIYMIGNLVSWWTSILCVSVFAGIMGADLLARRRGIEPIDPPMHSRMLNSGGFFFFAWAFHYFPFFLMNRQLFLHHYLPAHICSCLLTGAVFNFVASETINYPVSRPGPLLRPHKLRARTDNELPMPARAVAALTVAALIGCFWFLSPLTYGEPGLDPDQVRSKCTCACPVTAAHMLPLQVNLRRVLSSWTLHFAK
jgi:dolichyl-phosphate-mannose-protein mannosyltransferase